MEKTCPFYDLCVPYNADNKVMHSILSELVELGYKTIAIEQTFDHSKKADDKRGADIFPEPHSIAKLQEKYKNSLKILQRITILYADASVQHAMSASLILRKYNIVAGQPKTDAALTHCCTVFSGDLLTFDPVAGAKLMMNKKSYQIAVRRGMFFEIKYSPAIADSSNRKDMIRIAHNYCVRGKSKNIIFSSGATNPFELRGPYDVANLAYIFGLSEDQGKNAIDKSCRLLFLKAESRRVGKTVMFIKSDGPIVFSDSSDADEGGFDEMEPADDEANIAEESNDGASCLEQPNKKQRVC